jgi:hypothetical protein
MQDERLAKWATVSKSMQVPGASSVAGTFYTWCYMPRQAGCNNQHKCGFALVCRSAFSMWDPGAWETSPLACALLYTLICNSPACCIQHSSIVQALQHNWHCDHTWHDRGAIEVS